MLDEPDSLARLPEALKQIDPLVEARELLAVAQKKRKILGDIEQIQQRYASESSTSASSTSSTRRWCGRSPTTSGCAVPHADRDARRHHRPARERVRGRHPQS
jgi:hypothetical protein